MANYKDYTFNISSYGVCEEYTDASAIVLAIKNILLSRPGNYPFNPSFGMDIEKYQFELLDSKTTDAIKTELSKQISKFIPSLSNVFVTVSLVDDTTGQYGGRGILGISISSDLGNKTVDTNFLLYKDNDILQIVNETK